MSVSPATSVSDDIDLHALAEFDDHTLVSIARGDGSAQLSAVIAIHRENPPTPSFGATRLWHYASDLDGLRDALRLSRLMSYKAALAGLPCGGAKGVILAPAGQLNEAQRAEIIGAYAERVNLLAGRFITGTDVGIRQEDLATMRRTCSHIIGFNDNSTMCTALGVFESVRATLKEVLSSDELAGHSFAIQGLGKIGESLLAKLYEPAGESSRIYVSDIDSAQVAKICERYPRVQPVSAEDISSQEVDVFVPCALSGAINKDTIDRLACKAVVGGANNQLADDALGDALHARGILYAPDYVVNAGGLIAVFDEYQHPVYDRARVETAVSHIPTTLQAIFAESRASGASPSRVANALAEKIFNGYSANI